MGDYGLITLTAYYFLCQGGKTSDSPKYSATCMVIFVDNPPCDPPRLCLLGSDQEQNS